MSAAGKTHVDLGGPVLRLRLLGLSGRVRLRSLSVCLLVAAGAGFAGLVALSLGDYEVPLGRVAAIVLLGDREGFDATVVADWRGPRTMAALTFGAALGVAGAILQSITRNPLASPDIIGFSSGAYAGGITAIILFGGGFALTATGAFAGGLIAAAAVYLLAYSGGVQGFRLIVVGIGVTSVLSAFSVYLLLGARREVAMAAAVWGSGSLNGLEWHQVRPAVVLIAGTLVLLGVLTASMQQLTLGDDAAAALGVRTEPARLGLIVASVALTAIVTTVAGPIAFVALVAPQVARLLTNSAGVTLVPSALFGALLLTGLRSRRTACPAQAAARRPRDDRDRWLLSRLAPHPRSTENRMIRPASRLRAEKATAGYGAAPVLDGLSLDVPAGSFTVIVGPNACGKSTLLRTYARLLRPSSGQVLLDGKAIGSYRTREVAQVLGLLPQSAIAPDGMVVADLVSRGRHPHQGPLRRWSPEDEAAVARAMDATGVSELSGRRVDELSGGQRQRVWVAMALAQEAEILLLDEPTTFLDIAHQIDLMELFTDLHSSGATLVAVLHDLDQAARYATHLVAMRDGEILAQGDPREIVTAELVEDVFNLPCVVAPDPVTGAPSVTPIGRLRE